LEIGEIRKMEDDPEAVRDVTVGVPVLSAQVSGWVLNKQPKRPELHRKNPPGARRSPPDAAAEPPEPDIDRPPE
jgi:hypothetical protein